MKSSPDAQTKGRFANGTRLQLIVLLLFIALTAGGCAVWRFVQRGPLARSKRPTVAQAPTVAALTPPMPITPIPAPIPPTPLAPEPPSPIVVVPDPAPRTPAAPVVPTPPAAATRAPIPDLVPPIPAPVPQLPEDFPPAGALQYFKLTGDDVKALTQEFAGADTELKAILKRMEDREYLLKDLFVAALRCEEIWAAGVKDPVTCNDTGTTQLEDVVENRIVTRASKRRQIVSPSPAAKIVWDGGSCGCVKTQASDVVYGFYPSWESSPAKIDFSMQSRIAYFALRFDEIGSIRERGDWGERAQFVNEAHKFQTKVDLVLYNDDWSQWTQPGPAIIDPLTNQIAALLNLRMDGLLNRAQPSISLGLDSRPRIGDGVTLFFDFSSTATWSPSERDQVFQNLVSMIVNLKAKLIGDGVDRSLNLLLSAGDSLYSPENLQTLGNLTVSAPPGIIDNLTVVPPKVEDVAHDAYAVDLFLVLLSEPSTRTKKELRRNMENQFTGLGRRNMLRRIVPVISPAMADPQKTKASSLTTARGAAQQFDDDLVYFEDSFGGVGFFPVPMGKDQLANDTVTEVFQADTPTSVAELAAGPFRRICPNRWQARLILEGLILAFVICFALWQCSVISSVYMQVFGYLATLGLVILLAFDPFLSAYRDWTLVVAVILVAALVSARLYQNKKKAEYPSGTVDVPIPLRVNFVRAAYVGDVQQDRAFEDD